MGKAAIYDSNGVFVREGDDLSQTFAVNLALSYQYQAATIKVGLYNLFDEPLLLHSSTPITNRSTTTSITAVFSCLVWSTTSKLLYDYCMHYLNIFLIFLC